MKKLLPIFTVFSVVATGAFAADLTPYVGLGVVVDKAGTSAKRMGYDPNSAEMIVKNGGGDMDFDSAIAGEFTAGIKYGNVRGELEVAVRSASEDNYEIFNGTIFEMGPIVVPAEINTSTSVRHNSYMANFYYDFAISGSKWTPYVGAGIGLGTYAQKAIVEVDIDDTVLADLMQMPGAAEMLKDLPLGGKTFADDTLTEFEWQVGLGATYNFNENWALDIGYRFNSSTVEKEFVYAHELKVGARYLF